MYKQTYIYIYIYIYVYMGIKKIWITIYNLSLRIEIRILNSVCFSVEVNLRSPLFEFVQRETLQGKKCKSQYTLLQLYQKKDSFCAE